MDPSLFSLPPFRFDAATDTLWHGKRARRLRPRAAALLHYLLQHPGEVVTPDQILAALWPGVQVGPGVIKVYVWQIRQALRDRQDKPRFVETVPKRGYRWIAAATSLPTPAAGDAAAGRTPLVGREAELATLRQQLDRAEHGERQTVFVTGEPGIGKTALIEGLLRELEARPQLGVAAGQCIEHSGPGEAYLPVLTALGQLGRGVRRRQLVRVLARHAPTWLVQLPALLELVDADAVRRAAHGATRERMLRELADALEQLTARSAVVLVLEDLQWSDASTLDLIALLARRPGPARLLLLATYRPADITNAAHPLPELVRELALHDRCAQLPLGLLHEPDVARYVCARLAAADVEAADVEGLAAAIHQRTEGNPLFMVNVVDDLVVGAAGGGARPVLAPDAAVVVRRRVPPSLRQAIEARIEGLDASDQLLLEAASAVGAEFSAAALAAGLELPLEEVEQRAAALARRARLIEARGAEEWPDGASAARFAFVHAPCRAEPRAAAARTGQARPGARAARRRRRSLRGRLRDRRRTRRAAAARRAELTPARRSRAGARSRGRSSIWSRGAAITPRNRLAERSRRPPALGGGVCVASAGSVCPRAAVACYRRRSPPACLPTLSPSPTAAPRTGPDARQAASCPR